MILLDEPMSKHTTFKVGGPADVFVIPSCADEAIAVVGACRRLQVPYFILGKGSDLLVSDEGYRGVMVSLEALASIEVQGNTLVCGAGAALKDVAQAARKTGWRGSSLPVGFREASAAPAS